MYVSTLHEKSLLGGGVIIYKQMLSKEAIEEFKKIHKEHYGEDITDQEALELAQNLLNVYKIVYRPIPQDKDATSVKGTNPGAPEDNKGR